MKIIFAFPGREFSGHFLTHWSETLLYLVQMGHEVRIINEYSSYVPFSRMKTLGLDVLRGANQKPFDGKVEYDVWFTIDSDIFFAPWQVEQIIEDTNTYPVVSGLYRMVDLKHYACVKEWDEEYFKRHGSFKFMTPEEVGEEKEQYIKVAYNGMGFFACRTGVIENLKYPYFHAPTQEIAVDDGTIIRDICSEDVAFCRNLKAAGYPVWVNTKIKVGHEKILVI